MTLCIAAACLEGDEPRIVLCSDEMVSTGVASSQTESKREELPSFVAMFAGTIPEARELLSAYRNHLAENVSGGALSVQEWLERLREPLRLHKRRQIDHLVRRRLGLTYAEFLERGDQIDSGLRSGIFGHIDSLTIEVDLLFAGFASGGKFHERSRIFRARMEEVEIHKNFACIGIGAEAAEQALHRREQVGVLPLDWTLYHVYEAKRMGELAPTVGRRTSMAVVEPGGDEEGASPYRVRAVTIEGLEFLDGHYQRYGPQRVGDVTIPSDLRMFW